MFVLLFDRFLTGCFLCSDVAMDDCFSCPLVQSNEKHRAAPLGNGKRQVAKCGLIKPHSVREDLIF